LQFAQANVQPKIAKELPLFLTEKLSLKSLPSKIFKPATAQLAHKDTALTTKAKPLQT